MRIINMFLLAIGLMGALKADMLAADSVVPSSTTLSADQLEQYFGSIKRGTPIELTLDKGKSVKGLFGSYDDYYETVWIIPRGQRGAFSQKGYKLTGIRNAVPWDRKQQPAAAQPIQGEELPDDQYYLLNEKK